MTSANTPYWGELPVSKASGSRRPSADASLAEPDPRQSFDASAQPQPKSNRVSVLTTNTEAPTESTMSPFASPTSSSFPTQGLAPRPPSFPYGANRYPQQQKHIPQDTTERSRRRSSRGGNNDTDGEYDTETRQEPAASADGTEPLPAAPDVPRGPPLSYRPPYAGAHNYGYPPIPPSTPPSSRRPELSLATDPMELANPEQYYATTTSKPAGGDTRHLVPSVATSSGAPGGPSRRVSKHSSQHERRKKFEEVRSPLQKLELTLDSITKEEKRARVAAAEQVLRDREGQDPARTGRRQQQWNQQPQSQPQAREQQRQVPQQQQQSPPRQYSEQQVRSRGRSTTVSDGEPRPLLQPDASPVEESYSPIGTQRGPLPQTSPEPPASPPVSEGPDMRHRQPQSRSAAPSSGAASGIPQRNLSFRERAAQNEGRFPHDDHSEPSPTLPDSMVPKRTSSQRATLANEPSGDPWSNKRKAAERRYQAIQQRSETDANKAHPESSGFYADTKPPQKPQQWQQLQQPQQPESRRPREEQPRGQPAPTARQRRPSMSANADGGFSRPAMGFTGARDMGRAPQTDAAVLGDAATGVAAAAITVPVKKTARFQDDVEQGQGERRLDGPHHHRISNMLYHSRGDMEPGQGTYSRPTYLEEWKKSTVGTLHGALLDLTTEESSSAEHDKAWWEQSGKRRGATPRLRKGEAFDGEYDEANGPSRFKPPLHLVCGPLLRYCGMRKERSPNRVQRNGSGNGPSLEREFWRGSVMIVTRDTDSSYDIAPTLRLFVQPLDLLPPPPSQVQGALPPEYVDPLVGHPKLGRNGETLYVRPVEHISEAKDISRDETDDGLFEKTKSPGVGVGSSGGIADPPGSFAARLKRTEIDGERAGKSKDVRGFRLHAERGVTFWRFNIEVELRETQQRIAYRINRSPPTGFWVPAKGQAMHIMFHSCNGFSLSVNSDEFSGPDPLWRDVLNTHQTQPFHVMIGGGDQIYNDIVMRQTTLFQEWLAVKNPLTKYNAPFSAEMQDELEDFYLDRYAMWFSQGLFSLANSQIPMVNMYDDHDIIDGFGSYPHHFMNSPVFSGLGNVAFKYYMLFQHQSVIGETEESEPSWILGPNPGPYIEEVSRSLFMFLGAKVALLAVDCRTERMRDEVIREETWKRIMDRCYAEIEKGTTEHLIVLLGVPIAYPRLVWLENILTSRLMDPIKALGKTGLLGGFLNKFDGGVEVLDDLDDHWTAKEHKEERKVLIEDLQDLAADKSVRITLISGDVHLAAVGQFYSNQKLGVPKHKDFRYMPNVISSAIVNTPPPDLLADVLNKRNKVHHFDHDTDEDMIPLFDHGVDGKPRNNKRLLPHRNWCSIQPYIPGSTPTGSPEQSTIEMAGRSRSILKRSGSNVLRRNSMRRRAPPNEGESRPPLSGGLLRTLSRGRASADSMRREVPGAGTSMKRSFSLSRDFRPGNLFRRLSTRSQKRADDGGINGSWGPESEEDLPQQQERPPVPTKDYMSPANTNGEGYSRGQRYGQASGANDSRRANVPMVDSDGLSSTSSGEDDPQQRGRGAPQMRGGAGSASALGGYGHEEYETGDETYFSVKRRPSVPQRSQTGPADGTITKNRAGPELDESMAPPRRQFYRTPTGLTAKQAKQAQQFEVNLEGGLDIRLNVEVNPKEPTGITVPYRLLVPRLWYTYEGEDSVATAAAAAATTTAHHVGPTGLKRLLSLGRKRPSMEAQGQQYVEAAPAS